MVARLKPSLARLDTRTARAPPKQVDPFYVSAPYKAWRALVIGRVGGRCQWPGCGRAEARMFADHIAEIRDGGSRLDPANGQCLCAAHLENQAENIIDFSHAFVGLAHKIDVLDPDATRRMSYFLSAKFNFVRLLLQMLKPGFGGGPSFLSIPVIR